MRGSETSTSSRAREIHGVLDSFVVRANARSQRFADGKKYWSGKFGGFAAKFVERLRRNLQKHAFLVRQDISGARALVEKRDFSETFSRAQCRENRFLSIDHEAHPQLAVKHKIHPIVRIALFHYLRPLWDLARFHECGEAVQLIVAQLSQSFDAAKHAGRKSSAVKDKLGVARDSGGAPTEEQLEFGQTCGLSPAIIDSVENPRVRKDAFVFDPGNQSRKFDRTIDDVVGGPDTICAFGLV